MGFSICERREKVRKWTHTFARGRSYSDQRVRGGEEAGGRRGR